MWPGWPGVVGQRGLAQNRERKWNGSPNHWLEWRCVGWQLDIYIYMGWESKTWVSQPARSTGKTLMPTWRTALETRRDERRVGWCHRNAQNGSRLWWGPRNSPPLKFTNWDTNGGFAEDKGKIPIWGRWRWRWWTVSH